MAWIIIGALMIATAVAIGFVPIPDHTWYNYRGVIPVGFGLSIGVGVVLILWGVENKR